MKFQIIFALVVIPLVAAKFPAYSRLLQFSPNYLLNYTIDSKSVHFRIKAINVTGWVGIGLNDKRTDMDGADFYYGGWDPKTGTNFGSGFDYHVRVGGGNVRPQIDPSQDWHTIQIAEEDGTTMVAVKRHLNTSDTEDDILIQDKDVNLLWAYNQHDDNIKTQHTHRGYVVINLFRNATSTDNKTSCVHCEFKIIVFLLAIATGLKLRLV